MNDNEQNICTSDCGTRNRSNRASSGAAHRPCESSLPATSRCGPCRLCCGDWAAKTFRPIVSWRESAYKRLGLHYIVVFTGRVASVALAVLTRHKKAETDSSVTNFG